MAEMTEEQVDPFRLGHILGHGRQWNIHFMRHGRLPDVSRTAPHQDAPKGFARPREVQKVDWPDVLRNLYAPSF